MRAEDNVRVQYSCAPSDKGGFTVMILLMNVPVTEHRIPDATSERDAINITREFFWEIVAKKIGAI